ncbi:hypothetical protein SAMN04488095_0836 [Jannaschia pohangensis]|uniref:Uncharacterized protein n=1 Tax=Jannaschia pohangensis TaxID=390807 RepID=A0A1I3I6T0_9RHOB|nr:hypothetical protein SAMN04488095_0836 [Jannaschia pohangensis]
MGLIAARVWEDVHAKDSNGKYRGTNGAFQARGRFVFRWTYKASDPYGGGEGLVVAGARWRWGWHAIYPLPRRNLRNSGTIRSAPGCFPEQQRKEIRYELGPNQR